MSGPQDPERPIPPQPIPRDEAGQIEVDQRMADHAQSDRERRAVEDSGPRRIARLLEQLIDTQAEQLALQAEQTRLLQAILQALSRPSA
jgi:hypothetical protein